MERSLEDDGLIMAYPQCKCDSKICENRDSCVIQDPDDGDFFPDLDMQSGDPCKSDPNCYGDCTIVCTDFAAGDAD